MVRHLRICHARKTLLADPAHAFESRLQQCDVLFQPFGCVPPLRVIPDGASTWTPPASQAQSCNKLACHHATLLQASIHCSVVQVRPTWLSMNRAARKFAQRSSAVSTSRTRTSWSTRPSRRSRMTSRCRALAGSTVCLHRGGDHERGHSEVASSDARPIQPGPATAGSYLPNVNPCSRMSEMAVSQAAAS